MAEQQGPPVANQTRLDKLITERAYFTLAMQQLADDKIKGNPYSALVHEVLPTWQNAGRAPAPTGTTPRRRWLWYLPENYHAIQVAKRATIEKWAREFRLVDVQGNPADWIVGWAENLCQKLSGELREPTTIGKQLAQEAHCPVQLSS